MDSPPVWRITLLRSDNFAVLSFCRRSIFKNGKRRVKLVAGRDWSDCVEHIFATLFIQQIPDA